MENMMEVDSNDAVKTNSQCTTNYQVAQSKEETIYATSTNNADVIKERQEHEMVWKDLEDFEQHEEQHRHSKEKWEQDSLKYFEAVDLSDQTATQQRRQITGVKQTNHAVQYKKPDPLLKYLQNLKPSQQNQFKEQRQLLASFERLQVYEHHEKSDLDKF
ncbi:unnamed protein product [Rotaria sp. Silwood1]|nr:unnamed protein product [Rotaria sp. Silwood1]CAF1673370.1 unnamed protein product [Rotaria sp. Silwood1]